MPKRRNRKRNADADGRHPSGFSGIARCTRAGSPSMAPRLVPVLTPQPLPMPLEKWIEALERLCGAMDEIALLAERDLKRPSAQSPKS